MAATSNTTGGLRVAFAGTPEFAACALEAILAAGYDVPLVLTQPDRPAGRGMKLTPSAVKQARRGARDRRSTSPRSCAPRSSARASPRVRPTCWWWRPTA